MSDIIETGIAYRIQYAQRADGQWFRRSQINGRYGYQWSKWKATDFGPGKTIVNPYAGKARLPKIN